jgi:hypothetical protein
MSKFNHKELKTDHPHLLLCGRHNHENLETLAGLNKSGMELGKQSQKKLETSNTKDRWARETKRRSPAKTFLKNHHPSTL